MLMLIFVFLFILMSKWIQNSFSVLAKMVVLLLHPKSGEESDLEQQVSQLQRDKLLINMTDEFAKYAKTERKINKINEQLKKIKSQRNDAASKYQWGVRVAFHIIQVIIFVQLIWRWRTEPLVVIPNEWVWPLDSFIAFPSGIEGGVGITCWLLVCRSVLSRGQQVLEKWPSKMRDYVTPALD